MNKRIRSISSSKSKSSLSWTLFLIPIIFSVVGLIFVFEASSIRALSEAGDSFYYLKLQVRWIGIGIILMTIASFFPYKRLSLIAFPFMALVIVLLVLVLIPSVGSQVGGARRWIDLGFFSLQPTEFAKIATIIYLASWFSSGERRRFLPFISLLGFMMLLIFMQPDMGTAIIIFSLFMIMYYLAGKQLHYLLLLLPVSVVGGILLIFAAPYRLRRLTAFLNPSEDPMGVGYHINQILISLSQGGIFGRGFGASRQKYMFLPEAHTDSIFAIFGEELGFVGSVILIAFYIFVLWKLYQVFEKTSDKYGKLLIGGIFGFFGMQAVTNLGAMVGLLPLTGVPLPFISYGGSHILISFALIGIALNIAKSSKL